MKNLMIAITLFVPLFLYSMDYPPPDLNNIYSGKASVKAPISLPPVSISTDSNKIHGIFSAFITSISSNYIKSERSFPMKNVESNELKWNIKSTIIGCNFDIYLSSKINLLLSLLHSNTSGEFLYAGNLGIGYNSYSSLINSKILIGLNIHKSIYNANTIIYPPNSGTEIVINDKNSTVDVNPFISATLYTKLQNNLNYFFSFGYFNQTMLSYSISDITSKARLANSNENDYEPQSTAGFLYACPGVILKIMKNINIMFNLKIVKEVESMAKPSDILIIPSLQTDFILQ
jgi:hypothetical protein